MNLPQNAFEQLKLYFDGAPKNTVGEIWRLDTKQSLHFGIGDLDRAAEFATRASGSSDVYFCIGGSIAAKPSAKRMRIEDIRWMPGFYIDLDIYSDAKPEKLLPSSLDEGLAALNAIGMPSPWMIVATGNGYAVHYRFRRASLPVSDADAKDLSGLISVLYGEICHRLNQSKGWRLDPVAQSNRLSRIVGTFNRKGETAKPVECVRFDPTALTDLEELQNILRPKAPDIPKEQPSREASRSHKPLIDAEAKVEPVERYCAWLMSTVSRAAILREPEWYAASRFYVDDWPSRERFHEHSSLHPDYQYDETEAKLIQSERASPPRTCASIQRDFQPEGCKTCIFNGHINSPEKFAHADPGQLTLQSRFVFVASDKQYCDLLTGNRFDAQGFADKHMHLTGENMHDQLRRSGLTIKADRDDYIPGDARRIIRSGNEVVLNTFNAGGVDPIEGDWGVLGAHFEHLYPDSEFRGRVYDRLAHLLQYPALKIRHALLTIAAQGTGKNFIAKLLQYLLGESNVKIVPGEVTGSKYTAELAGCSVLVFEELSTFSSPAVYEALKPFVSEDRARAEQKYKDGRSVFTPRFVLAYSNHPKPIKLDEGDRRFDVYASPMQPQSPDYYTRLWGTGLAQASAFKHWLMNRDISKFDPNAPPPLSEDKQLLLAASRGTLEKALESMIKDGISPFNEPIFSISDVREALVQRRVRGIGDDRDIMLVLQRMDAQSLGQLSVRGRRGSYWTLWTNKEAAKAAIKTLV